MLKVISSWFQKSDSGPSRKNMTLKTTRDAFSLPTHSPTLHSPSHPSPYSDNVGFTDSFDEPLAGTSSYTYPPQSSDDLGRYGSSTHYDCGLPVPHKGPLLPIHQTRSFPSSSYPPLANTWSRVRSWLSEEYPELGDTLNWGCFPEMLDQVEAEIGYSLPNSVRESFIITDGQEPESLNGCPEGLFFGLTCLTLEEAVEEWKFWRSVDHDPSTGSNPSLQATMQSIPSGFIRCQYSDPGWFPLVTDRAGNYLGIDMNPGEKGAHGQVIVFGRDFDVKIVLSHGDGDGGWARWLAGFADELEAGESFEVGVGSGDASEESDDGIGYRGYFFDGSGNGKGQGDTLSSGGLRLTGNYRGWPVLEAFADRAFHSWQHLGMITNPSTPLPNGVELVQSTPSKEVALIQIPENVSADETSVGLVELKLDDKEQPPPNFTDDLSLPPQMEISLQGIDLQSTKSADTLGSSTQDSSQLLEGTTITDQRSDSEASMGELATISEMSPAMSLTTDRQDARDSPEQTSEDLLTSKISPSTIKDHHDTSGTKSTPVDSSKQELIDPPERRDELPGE